MNTRVWVIIVTYHPDVRSIHSLVHVLEGYDIIIVDNSEGQISGDLSTNKNILFIPNDRNLGYGGGANIGLHYAFNHGAQWGIVLNQDVSFSKVALEQFIQSLENEPGIVGPNAGSLDQKRWSTILPKRETIDYISGECIAIHKKVYEKLHGFYEPYFMYYEDVDFSMRAKNAGFSLKTKQIASMKHNGTMIGTGSILHEYYLSRNHLLFVERCAPLSVKFHEWIRLPKTYSEHIINRNIGAKHGIIDYLLRQFCRSKYALQQNHAMA